MGRAPERLEGTIEPEPRIDLLRELVGSRDDRLQRGADIFVTMALAARERTGVAPQKGKMRCELLSKRHDLRNLLAKIGRAHVGTPVTNAQLVCRLQLEQTTHTIFP